MVTFIQIESAKTESVVQCCTFLFCLSKNQKGGSRMAENQSTAVVGKKADGKFMLLLKQIIKHRALMLMLLVGLVYYAIFHYAPLAGIQIAFRDFKVYKPAWKEAETNYTPEF